jgi:hypothetical protein
MVVFLTFFYWRSCLSVNPINGYFVQTMSLSGNNVKEHRKQKVEQDELHWKQWVELRCPGGGSISWSSNYIRRVTVKRHEHRLSDMVVCWTTVDVTWLCMFVSNGVYMILCVRLSVLLTMCIRYCMYDCMCVWRCMHVHDISA